MRSLLLWIFSHRTLALVRWDIHFLKIRMGAFLFNRKKSIILFLKNDSPNKYLNLGSGPRGVESKGWFNVDGYKDRNIHYLCDFNRELPFPSDVLNGIFCEHVLEHFDYENGSKLMRECKRIMKTGATIRIIVPDGKKILDAYFTNPEKIVAYKTCKTGFPMEAVNSWFYQRYEHQCIYDSDYLIDMLLVAGFSRARKCAYRQSAFGDEAILLDDSKYDWESLYVEAIK